MKNFKNILVFGDNHDHCVITSYSIHYTKLYEFQPIKVEEPSVAHTIEILNGLRDRYETHHRVTITDQAVVAAANLADRYISDRFLPDKAIDLIDEAGSRLRMRRMQAPPDFRELEDEIASYNFV